MPNNRMHLTVYSRRSYTAGDSGRSRSIAAGFMLAEFTKYLRSLPVAPDTQVNLLRPEMTVTGPKPIVNKQLLQT